ncbi:MAG: hypothetical protein Q7J78_00610, partial [Clostridiales bacterium]|nr:hypothetical protein [Clostridiales bacterium]
RDVALACVLAAENDSLDDFEVFFLDTDNLFGEDTRLVVERLYPDISDMAVNLKGKEGIISTKRIRDKLGYRPKYSWRSLDI